MRWWVLTIDEDDDNGGEDEGGEWRWNSIQYSKMGRQERYSHHPHAFSTSIWL